MLEKVMQEAAAIVTAIDAGRLTLDDALDNAPGDCRRTLEHLLSQLYRYRKSIRKSWSKFCRRQPDDEIAVLLDTALTQCRLQSAVAAQSVVNVAVTLAKKKHADKFVNAVLRSALREEWAVPSKAADILPDELLKVWRKNFSPAQVDFFAGLFLKKPSFTFRLCGQTPIPENCEDAGGFPPFRFASGRGFDILDSAEFARGDYYIQDPAASLAVSLAADILPECRRVIDLCAAPGGKALMAAELMGGKGSLTAADISEKRQKLTAENFAVRQIDARIITADTAAVTGEFDLVIADVPCSNSGVFRRRPDALWRFTEKSLDDVMKLQKSIVADAARLVVPGGHLLLSTCSIEYRENQALAENLDGFVCLKEHSIMPNENHDGAFAGLWQKLPR
jgi:16S rRNA (cytosine967-C5)-methyltransferase